VRWLAFLAVVAAAFGSQGSLAATGTVPGRLVGTWTNAGYVLTLKANGKAVFKLGPEVIPETVAGTPTRVTFGAAGVCSRKGSYSWKRTGRSLTFRPAGEPCSVRRSFLTVAWTRR
jgi:hypothetical protein